jgi:capsular exopolysaccharide synthesis family protein
MSRIREALKKAAEERSWHVESRATEELMDTLTVATPEPSMVSVAAEPAKYTTHKKISESSLSCQALLASCRRLPWHIRPRYSVFSREHENSSGSERFRTLRSRLYQVSAVQSVRRVLLTSSVPEEGKTFVASNLAQSMVRQADRKVMLVDADLRASRLHMTLGTENEPGLSDYLSGERELTEIVQRGDADNFCFIPSGRHVSNPSELLHSDKMKHLLEKMSELFDWVILDSPPANAVHDASILADMCDGVLFVVRAGTTDYETAKKAAAEFETKNLLGVVLNRVEKQNAHGEYYYYGYLNPQEAE